MRLILSLLVSLSFFGAFAQEAEQVSKWEFGVQLDFNSGFVKPGSADTFTNKAGFGAGLFLERKFDNLAVQVMPSFAQTRYSNDPLNLTAITNSLDLNINICQPIDQRKQTFLFGGPVVGYAFQHNEINIDGSRAKASDIRNRMIRNEPLDYGVKLGFAMDLKQGSRLTVSYTDFFRGRQYSGDITGRIDYFQFGVQFRINELSSSEATNNKFEREKKRIRAARNQAIDLQEGNSGLMVFVLPKIKKDYIGPYTPEKEAESRERQLGTREALIQAINSIYTHGDYVITLDSLFDVNRSNRLKLLVNDEIVSYDAPSDTRLYFARIDELFIEDNGNLKWGIFTFDQYMTPLEEPFPFFIPYRHLDKDFESAGTMISELNSRLQTLASEVD